MSAAKPSTAKTAKKLNPAGAEKLKAQGNALYAQRKWAGAHAKYSEAIEQDDTNPVYWANRAACNLETKEYVFKCLILINHWRVAHLRASALVSDTQGS